MEHKKFIMNQPEGARLIIEALQEAGYTAYVVGGCVRDAVLNKIPHDYDICTSATPDEMKAVFENKNNKTYDTGIQHGTISVAGSDGELYEVTTYRIDGDYADGRHPDSVAFVRDVKEDLSRRDFTINAMAYNYEDGLVDPFGGQVDCTNKIIRCVGDPNVRFQEDALRMMRAIRFASTYGFKIDDATAQAIHDNKHLLRNVSEERKTSEFIKFITHTNRELLLQYNDLIAEFIPEIKPMVGFDQCTPWHKYDVFEHTARAVELAPHDTTLRLAAFFHDIGKPHVCMEVMGRRKFLGHQDKSFDITVEAMKRMRFDTKTIKDVSAVVKHHDDPLIHNADRTNIKSLLRLMGEDTLRRVAAFQLCDKQASRGTIEEFESMRHQDMTYEDAIIFKELKLMQTYDDRITQTLNSGEPYRIKDLAVNGNDLIGLGIEGEDIGDTLQMMVGDVIRNPSLNTKDKLMKLANHYHKYWEGETEIQPKDVIEAIENDREI